VTALKDRETVSLDELGPKVRVDYVPDGTHGREWLEGLLSDLADDGLVALDERDGETVARLRR
jgi:A/G-specific adenine glycosylase